MYSIREDSTQKNIKQFQKDFSGKSKQNNSKK